MCFRRLPTRRTREADGGGVIILTSSAFNAPCARPRAQAYAEQFAREIEALAPRLPGLERMRLVLCYPLRRHGRILRTAHGQPTIAVGVADPDLGVPPLHPVMQACHEFFVQESLPSGGTAANYATVPGRHGYDVFAEVERKALRRGGVFFAGSPWEQAYIQWLAVTCPGRTLEELLGEE